MTRDHALDGSERITAAILACAGSGEENVARLFDALSRRMREGGRLLVPVEQPENTAEFCFKWTQIPNHLICVAAFTDEAELRKGSGAAMHSYPLAEYFRAVCDLQDCAGLVLDPWGDPFFLHYPELLRLLERTFPQGPDTLP